MVLRKDRGRDGDLRQMTWGKPNGQCTVRLEGNEDARQKSCRLNRRLTRLTELLWRVAQKQNRMQRSFERLWMKT